MLTIKVDIKNWKDLVSQFGLGESQYLYSAKEISKRLRKQVEKVISESGNNDIKEVSGISVDCSKQSEAVALFTLIRTDGVEFIYEYNGTAN